MKISESKKSNLIKTQPIKTLIDPKVKARLTELYYSMRAIEYKLPTETGISDKPQNTSVKSCSTSPRKIPRISSYSPDREPFDLPDRPESFYQKLNFFYKQKHESQKNAKKIDLIDRFNKTSNKLIRANYVKINKTKKNSDVPKVPSLFIRIC